MKYLKLILSFIFRPKSITTILWVLVLFLLSEMIAIANQEGLNELFQELKADKVLIDWHLYYPIRILEVIYGSGNIYVAGIVGILIFFFGFLKYKETPNTIEVSSVKVLSPENKNYFDSDNKKLGISIKREIEDRIFEYITNNKNPISIIQGEEGIGKSILSLQIAQRLSSEKYIVRYFESLEWESIECIEELIFSKISNNFTNSLLSEEKTIVIFLDGVNEKNALNTSRQILKSFKSLDIEIQQKIKIIFTTRDLSSYTDYIDNEWNSYKKFPLNKFTEDELKEAISKLEPTYDFIEFPEILIDVASIPRYLTLAFKLKNKFNGFGNVTKEMLYWERLKEQIKNDTKIRELDIADDSDIENILCNFIDKVTIDDNKVFIDKNDLKDIFGKDYLQIKTQLSESRIVKSKKTSTVELNFDMVVIAYSIYLLSIFEKIDTSLSIEEIADFFKEKLEPYNNDNMTNIPYIVFQLSLEKEYLIDKKIHSALLYLWLNNHNSIVMNHYLYFWAEKSLYSFINILDIVEYTNIDFNRSKMSEIMLQTLSFLWSKEKGSNKELKQYLKSTILLEDIENDSELYKILLPIKRAFRILFTYNTDDFLDIFLEMFEKLDSINIEEKSYLKYEIELYLSMIFRFAYSENIYDILKNNLKYKKFASYYKSYDLSNHLSLPLKQIESNHNIFLFTDKLSKKQQILDKFDIDNISLNAIKNLSHIACRKNLDLCEKDKEVIKTTLDNLSKNFEVKTTGDQYLIDWVYDEFPSLLASFNSDLFNEINQKFLFETVQQKAFWFEVDRFNLVILQNQELSEYIVSNFNTLIDRENDKTMILNQLIEIILFSSSKDNTLCFFKLLIEQEQFANIFIPNGTRYIKMMIEDDLLDYLYTNISIYQNDNIDDSELYNCYMTYLYILEDFQNELLIDWSINNLNRANDKDKSEFYRDILIETMPSKYFNDVYINGSNKKAFYQQGSSKNGVYLSWWITREKNFYQDKTFDELLEILPVDSIGILLHHNERFDELNQWGKYIFENCIPRDIGDYDIKEPMTIFSENNKEYFSKEANKYLTTVNNIFEKGGRHMPSFRTFENLLINLLIPIDFESSCKFYNKTSESRNIKNSFFIELLDTVKYNKLEYKSFRKNIILGAKNDLEYLHIVVMAFQNNAEAELLEICNELLQSIYAIERLRAISMLMWCATDESIIVLQDMQLSDDSEYVRAYARWGEQISLQEKYMREIYEEVLIEDNLEVISAKLNQIYNSITPTAYYWIEMLNKKYNFNNNRDKLKMKYISRYLDRVTDKVKDDKKIEVFDRKLIEYYCGEKLDDNFKYIVGID